MVSLTVLGLLIARYAETRTIARCVIVASAVPVTLVLNALRVTLTAIAAHYFGPSAAQGAVHEAAGMVLFVFATVLLMACARAVAAMRIRLPVELAR
jgi:exosortase/archaeosortase family protein